MKKQIFALAAMAAVLALTACGASDSPGSSVPASTVQSQPESTATVDGETSVYTTEINEAIITLTISSDQKTVTADAMGMVVEGTCEVADGVLTMKELTSGNAQVWAGLASQPFTLNQDGTATVVGASGAAQEAEIPAEELFSWDGFASLVFNKDGTYDFNYNDLVKETGTWTWQDWTLTVTDSAGNEMVGVLDKEDNNTLKLEFTAVANEELVVNFTAASNVWGMALGTTGTYTPENGAGSSAAGGVERFAGEYDLYCEEKDMYCEEFVIEPDGTIHGVVESSGLTSFEGTVGEDGTITAEVTRLGGTMTGTISDDLQVNVHFEVRGSVSDFAGGPL